MVKLERWTMKYDNAMSDSYGKFVDVTPWRILVRRKFSCYSTATPETLAATAVTRTERDCTMRCLSIQKMVGCLGERRKWVLFVTVATLIHGTMCFGQFIATTATTATTALVVVRCLLRDFGLVGG